LLNAKVVRAVAGRSRNFA